MAGRSLLHTLVFDSEQRECDRAGHDTWDCGRYASSGNCRKCSQEQNARYAEIARERRADTHSEFMPKLKALREKRGYELEQIAWESRLDEGTLERIELELQRASYQQRVQIFQAFNILRAREIEAREEQLEEGRRRVRAGLG